MPSPFPGMDPYLEAPDIWPDFHQSLAVEMRKELNLLLPPPYYARVEMRPELGIILGEGAPRHVVPDVVVVRHPTRVAGPVATLVSERRSVVSEPVRVTVNTEPFIVNSAYDGGPYRRLLNYHDTPDPPLTEEQAKWADELLRQAGLRE